MSITRLAACAAFVLLVVGPTSAAAQDATPTAINIVEPSDVQSWTYDPQEASAATGTPVVWTNLGAVAHTATSDDGASFDSGDLPAGATFTFTPPGPGTFAYHCTYHPWMVGSLTVN
jgi:plastocyanin